MREDNEPTLEKLDDYNGKESPEKRRIIWLVALSALAVGAIFALFGMNPYNCDIVDTMPKSEAK